jgi:hypothetical protein
VFVASTDTTVLLLIALYLQEILLGGSVTFGKPG